MSAVKMLKPAQGEVGVKEFVVQTMLQAGGNPCPPIIIGVGLGRHHGKGRLAGQACLVPPHWPAPSLRNTLPVWRESFWIL